MNLSCLFCGNPIHVHNRMKTGEQLSCSQCKTVFRLVSKTPFKIDWLQIKEGNTVVPDEGEPFFDELE
jgi:hypothetical protein